MKTTYSNGNCSVTDLTAQIDSYLKRLFPITRSITGDGNRETLKILQEIIPLQIKEYPSGKKVYDWVIPKEWNIRDAWIKNSKGEKIVDFKKCNLHVVSYSIPVNTRMKYADLKQHLHYREDMPGAIPYRTSYYKEDWGFCVSYSDYQKYFNSDGEYEVFIDSELKDGSLTVGEYVVKGESTKEFLISTYICHPSLANDNLSGPILTAFLGRELSEMRPRYSYRIIFVPETIGAIVYCAMNEAPMKSVDCGFVVTSVGGAGKLGYKQSFDPRHYINRFIEDELRGRSPEFATHPFDVHGSDERQYSSQGFRMNVATICKDKYYEYPSYHTSADDLRFVKPENIRKTYEVYCGVIRRLESQLYYKSAVSSCEVMLSKRGLYPQGGGGMLPVNGRRDEIDILLWLLFYCDGRMPLSEIARRLEVHEDELKPTVRKLEEKGILRRE